MRIDQTLRVAVKGLGHNRLRSALTMLGVVIGVTAVVSLLSIGRGSKSAITSQIESMGTNLLYVSPGAVSDNGVKQAYGSATTLTLEDADAIAAGAPSVEAVAPESTAFAQLVAG